MVWSPKINGLAGEYRVGCYKSTAHSKDVLDDSNGNPQPLTGADFAQHSSRNGYWLVAQQHYVPLQHNEISSEIYYGLPISNWLTVRPNLQSVKCPGGVPEIDAALIGGLNVQAKF
jgi:porin